MSARDVVIAAALAIVFAAAFATLFDLAPLIAKALVRQAARWWQSDLDTTEQLEEEWQALIDARPVGVLKIGTGLAFWMTGALRQVRLAAGQPAASRLITQAGLALFLAVVALEIAVDYLIFRGLHPSGTGVLPLALACLAVVGIATGSVLTFDASRGRLLLVETSLYVRRIVVLGGAMLAVGIAAYMVAIAPYRSYSVGEAHIS